MKCDNYEEDGDCRYYQALIGTGEPPPSGMDSSGHCEVADDIADLDDWFEAEPKDCDMLDLEE